jgi:hypothetical protein
MKSIKPVVIGYKQSEFDGRSWDDSPFEIMSREELFKVAVSDRAGDGMKRVKSKFRPVYQKES